MGSCNILTSVQLLSSGSAKNELGAQVDAVLPGDAGETALSESSRYGHGLATRVLLEAVGGFAPCRTSGFSTYIAGVSKLCREVGFGSETPHNKPPCSPPRSQKGIQGPRSRLEQPGGRQRRRPRSSSCSLGVWAPGGCLPIAGGPCAGWGLPKSLKLKASAFVPLSRRAQGHK